MPRNKLAPKKQRQLFLAKVAALLLDLGATPSDYDFALPTRVGLLKLHPSENMTEGLGTVFTRFDDPKAATELVPSNPYSGKWNFHFFNGWSVESALEEFTLQLAKVLP